jgi:hypothetical protein
MVILANKEVEYFSSPDWTEFADLPDGRFGATERRT